jgi:hypothetical protein
MIRASQPLGRSGSSGAPSRRYEIVRANYNILAVTLRDRDERQPNLLWPPDRWAMM